MVCPEDVAFQCGPAGTDVGPTAKPGSEPETAAGRPGPCQLPQTGEGEPEVKPASDELTVSHEAGVHPDSVEH